MTNNGIWRVAAVGVALWSMVSSPACAVDGRQLTEEEQRDSATAGARDASLEAQGSGGQGARPDASVAGDGSVRAGGGGAGSGSGGSSVMPRDAMVASDAAAGLPDGVAPCAVGTKRCDGACVAVDDPTYGCGATTCSRATCPAAGDAGTVVCQGGACVLGACADGQKKCGSACVAIDDPTYGCGLSACEPCTKTAGATMGCRAGACVVATCAAGTKKCGDVCVAVDDVNYGCGATTCDKTTCPSSTSGALVCQAGACVLGACATGFKKCGGQCVSINDPTYGCGAATCDALACPSPGTTGTLTCAGGACVIGTCGAGTKKCGNKCVPTDANNGCADAAKCTACGASETCVGAPSVCTCVPNTSACTGKDCGLVTNNCGASISCGTCTAPKTCGGGGAVNTCGCTPVNPCLNGACGTGLSDKCGGIVNCGCSGQATCGGAGMPGVCGVPVPVLAAQGQPCASAAACANGRCVDGVCCASTSCGTCRKCNLNGLGTCADVPAGTADPACPASVASCMAGGCSGAGGTCRPAALGTSCGKTCTNGSEPAGGGQYAGPSTLARVCNGSVAGAAACVAASAGPQYCAGGALCADATNCRSPASCTRQADCSSGYYCLNSVCTQKIGDGFACTTATECISRVCTGTRDDRTPHCATCMTPYDCPHDRPWCSPNSTCIACTDAVPFDCQGASLPAHANGSISCTTASCPANATDCNAATDECHCGALQACDGGQICVNSQCKVAPLWPCVSNDCAYGSCANGVCPQAPVGSFCTGLLYPISECAGGASCGGRFVSPPGSPSFGTRACGP